MRGSRLAGSGWMIEMRELTTRRLTPAADGGALNAVRTASSMPNSRNAASTESSVKIVRVLRRNSAAQIRWKYFMCTSLAFPFSRLREKVPKADEGLFGTANHACPHPALSRKRERGKRSRDRGLLHKRALVQMQRMP